MRSDLCAYSREGVEQEIELPLTAYERSLPLLDDVHAEAGPGPQRLPHGHRRGLAFRSHRLGLPILDRVAGCQLSRLPNEDPIHRRPSLEPRGRVDDVSGDERLALLRPCVQRHERLAGIDRDPQLEPARLGRGPVPDGERRPHGPLGVVLVRQRRAEDGHHRVADELLDRAAEVLELLPEARLVRPEQPHDVLGVHLLGTGGEADEVREEYGDDLALLARCSHGLSLGFNPSPL